MDALPAYVPHGALGGWKRAADPLELVTYGCELPCGCRESSPDPLQEYQHMF